MLKSEVHIQLSMLRAISAPDSLINIDSKASVMSIVYKAKKKKKRSADGTPFSLFFFFFFITALALQSNQVDGWSTKSKQFWGSVY